VGPARKYRDRRLGKNWFAPGPSRCRTRRAGAGRAATPTAGGRAARPARGTGTSALPTGPGAPAFRDRARHRAGRVGRDHVGGVPQRPRHATPRHATPRHATPRHVRGREAGEPGRAGPGQPSRLPLAHGRVSVDAARAAPVACPAREPVAPDLLGRPSAARAEARGGAARRGRWPLVPSRTPPARGGADSQGGVRGPTRSPTRPRSRGPDRPDHHAFRSRTCLTARVVGARAARRGAWPRPGCYGELVGAGRAAPALLGPPDAALGRVAPPADAGVGRQGPAGAPARPPPAAHCGTAA
jgi:hypothetical protein